MQRELTRFADAAAHLEAHTEQLMPVMNAVLDSTITMEQAGTIEVIASAGVSLFPNDAADESGLIAAADQRMYEVKRSHR